MGVVIQGNAIYQNIRQHQANQQVSAQRQEQTRMRHEFQSDVDKFVSDRHELSEKAASWAEKNGYTRIQKLGDWIWGLPLGSRVTVPIQSPDKEFDQMTENYNKLQKKWRHIDELGRVSDYSSSKGVPESKRQDTKIKSQILRNINKQMKRKDGYYQGREDATAVCKKGKPCGDYCIPKKANCQDVQKKAHTAGVVAGVAGLGLAAGAAVVGVHLQQQGERAKEEQAHAERQQQRNKQQREQDERFAERQKQRDKEHEEWKAGYQARQEARKKDRDEASKRYEEFKKKNQERTQSGGKNWQDYVNEAQAKKQNKTSSGENWWDVLGVKETATKQEVKQKIRELSQKYHPDVNKQKGAEEKFKQISEAYNIWKEKQPRADSKEYLKTFLEIISDFKKYA
jgi:hypothetical protein